MKGCTEQKNFTLTGVARAPTTPVSVRRVVVTTSVEMATIIASQRIAASHSFMSVMEISAVKMDRMNCELSVRMRGGGGKIVTSLARRPEGVLEVRTASWVPFIPLSV